jgi:hypothetical protein
MYTIEGDFSDKQRLDRATLIITAFAALAILAAVFSLFNVSRTDRAAYRAEAMLKKNQDQLRTLLLQNRSEQNTNQSRFTLFEKRLNDLEERR